MPDESASAHGEAGGGGWGVEAAGHGREPRRRRRRGMKIAAWTVAGVLVLGGSTLGFAFYKFNGNISGVDINAALGTQRPVDTPDGSMDILVLGSDSRSGTNGKYGADEGGARSDTAMIVHINKKHDRASIVSIPRDTVVQRPACALDGDSRRYAGAGQSMFNSAYEIGGPPCAVKTVESMSGIRMDHFLEIDFSGFKKLVDTLGGVEVTTDRPMKDEDSHLDIGAGTHRLSGEESLGLVRTRHGVADGSDLGRIKLQQAFLKALIKQVDSVGVFSNPKKLYELADTATSAITTDSELDSTSDVAGLAQMLKGIAPEDIQMTTMPVEYDPMNRNRVLPLTMQTEQVWRALKNDTAIPKSATENSAGRQTDIKDVVR